ncbi:hypothetical protein BANT918_00896 [Brevibacterium antiquum CNRZ 918]|uniref:Uncharacterized protein n=2 Tax=Brevibacterium TaxID=1696 RepID=A0A2H1IE89_9MICO|nr:hypothetical protein BANT918_00896 [Brevibacterium antiquum CNRZ 918]
MNYVADSPSSRRHLHSSVESFLSHHGLLIPQVKAMSVDIKHRPDLELRLPRLVAYALHQEKLYPTLRAAESLGNSRVQKVLLRGITLFAREAPWADQVDFVVNRLLPLSESSSRQTETLISASKILKSDSERSPARKRIVQRARLTKKSRPYQLAVLRDIGWLDTAEWLNGQPYAASTHASRPSYSPSEIKALNLPKIDGDSASRKKRKRPPQNKLSSSPAPTNRQQIPEPTANETTLPPLRARSLGGALVVFDTNIFDNLKRRLEISNWRVISADTYFLAEALSVHQRWVVRFSGSIRISSGTVIDQLEVRVQPKGLVVDLWNKSAEVDRVNFQRSLLRSKIEIPTDTKQGIGLILLYIFNKNRKLKKSILADDVAVAHQFSAELFQISSVYRVKTPSSLADIGVHSKVSENSDRLGSERHDVRGHNRRVGGVDYRVRAHRRGR